MKFRVKNLAISTGNPMIALMNKKDAIKYNLHYSDRVRITKGKKEVVAFLDISNSHGIVLPGQIGLFQEVYEKISLKDDEKVTVHLERKPKSIDYIKEKMRGKHLKKEQMQEIVEDIVNSRLNEIELAYFVSATYMNELSEKEVVYLTKSVVRTGETLKLKKRIVVDKHCIGGVAGNRTTMIVVPIVAAAGLPMPKTSSRSITSAAGTADTVEVLCNVSFSMEDMKKIVKKTGGCLIWGGGMNLAPADDKIIKVEHPMSLDPVGQLLASILAKKKSVSATHVLIDIPVGRGCKTESMKRAKLLKRKFVSVGKKLGMHVKVMITDGSVPIGNGIGPALEARDVFWTLQNSSRAALDLREKSIKLAGAILETAGKTKNGIKMATEILDSGKAYDKFIEIIKAQKAKITSPEKIKLAKHKKTIRSNFDGRIRYINNKEINRIAKLAGAPQDKQAGLYLHVHKGDMVKKGDPLFTIYSNSDERMRFARNSYKTNNPFEK